ncbi:MAG: wax ester/triacylglycerol synthase family O-acyltransferase [Burkholderiales bacterium]|nr:wax ester/triacylglycerol synthase family O-acyltransferase [Burkholderiales bacterium]
MKQLPGLDASFLHLETPQMPMHVGALHNFELPADYDGDFLADMRRHMAARLVLAPALRQKLMKMPLNLSNPTWVDDEPDLDEHVVGITLPKGSGQAELETQVGLLHTVLLDRSRPLWKFHVFDGLADGPGGTKRFAMYTQLHHAAVDGQAAVALGQAILDLSPAGREVDQQRRGKVRRELGLADMLRGVLGNQAGLVLDAVKAIPGTVGVLSQMATRKVGDTAGGTMASVMARLKGQGAAARGKSVSNLALAPRTRLNTTVSATRAFASISLPLAALNATRRKHKASLNDAVLMVCSGALRRHFLKHGPLPRKSLVAGVPVSTRAKGDTSSNNQATMTVVSLGTHIADPAKRLAHVLAATAAMKNNLGAMKSLMPTDFPSLGVPWLMESLSNLYAKARVADRLPAIANVTISNVPGPTVPLYMAGAKMLTNYPTSIVVHGVALNITVQTYNESLEFGLIACGEAMPEVAELARHVQAAFGEFQALPASVVVEPTPPPKAVEPAARKVPAAKKAPARKTAPSKTAKVVARATPAPRASAPKKAASRR